MSYYIISDIVHYCNVKVTSVEGMASEFIDYYDLTFVLEGKMIYVINGEKIVLSRNDVLFLPPKTDRVRLKTFEKCAYVSLNFLSDSNLTLPVFMKNALTPAIRKLLSVYPDTYIPDFNSEKKCAYFYNYILNELFQSVELSTQNPHIRKMLDFISLNITKPISLDELAMHTNLTKEYCCQIFKKETGESPINYINRQKMTVAKNLIQHNRMSLSDICAYLGFDNYNYFSRLFKKYNNVPPTSFKK